MDYGLPPDQGMPAGGAPAPMLGAPLSPEELAAMQSAQAPQAAPKAPAPQVYLQDTSSAPMSPEDYLRAKWNEGVQNASVGAPLSMEQGHALDTRVGGDYQPGMLIPAGGSVSSGGSTTRLSKEAKAETANSLKTAKVTQELMGRYGVVQQENAATYADRAQALAADVAARNKADLDEHAANQERIAQRQADWDKQSQAVIQAQKDVDPDRKLKGWRGALAAIASAAGAYSATLGRTDNFAQKIIDNSIARDWQSQKDVVQAKKDQLTTSERMIVQARQMYQDQHSARLAYTASMQQVAAQELGALAARHKGTEMASGLQVQASEMLAKSQQTAAELYGREVSTSTSSRTTNMAAYNPAADSQTLLDRQVATAEKVKKINDATNPIPPGSEAQATDLNKSLKSYASSVALVQDATKILADTKALALQPAMASNAKNKFNQYKQNLAARVKHELSGTASSDKETQDIVGGIMGAQLDNDGIARSMQTFTEIMAKYTKVNYDMANDHVRNGARSAIERMDPRARKMLETGKWQDVTTEADDLGGKLR